MVADAASAAALAVSASLLPIESTGVVSGSGIGMTGSCGEPLSPSWLCERHTAASAAESAPRTMYREGSTWRERENTDALADALSMLQASPLSDSSAGAKAAGIAEGIPPNRRRRARQRCSSCRRRCRRR